MVFENERSSRALSALRALDELPSCPRGVAWVAAAICIALPFAFAPRAARAQDTIKIGVPVPLSGSYQQAGNDILDGARLAVAQINAAGGVLGKKLELVQQDDACNPDQGANAATQLVAAGVAAVAGGYCSSAALPETRVLHDWHIPYVLDASTSPQLTEHGWTDVFRTIGRVDAQGVFAAQFMKDVLHARRAAVLNDGTTYSDGLAKSTVAALKQNGIAVVYDAAMTPGQSDYRAVVKAAADPEPDVLYFTGYYTEAAVLAKNRREKTPAIRHFMGNGTADPSLIEKGGEAVEGMIVTTSPLPQFLDNPNARRFVKAYEAAYQRAPGPYSVYEYDAVGVIAAAIKYAKSDRREDIAAALHKLKGYSGATGEIAFDQKGDRANAAFMAVTVRDGKFEPYANLNAKGRWIKTK
ncbi:branched-chain amino acid ABC transporter substrate-binding protein [Trinickia caryophylli]|uniref:Amino acid/amide ABC transporter substrate-binding protein, HAAT family n=1 Tax=Trinickia caryophylli TaxID=28094 RepID=A0A1X7CJF6_TRICW|nr:branched-chain amino acid ABC transporter substrate-binding protein [Trinickia caryophylli]PMS11492.1 branched-chain amino acid ABC transporter substrate-binding protein [Trinickia caryophylli]TRX19957.1 branched-chain amino acid ABC transporter substrate-binding protein [Trinickia caryophylli]WQE12705.1 branched-chain amino acid ABC transporter substrate-binding protein [Trinickia caryophylli]SME97623.1 amino acid/amide ABC transporter substrate-binding protein, HAAT family [Trinickia caryo